MYNYDCLSFERLVGRLQTLRTYRTMNVEERPKNCRNNKELDSKMAAIKEEINNQIMDMDLESLSRKLQYMNALIDITEYELLETEMKYKYAGEYAYLIFTSREVDPYRAIVCECGKKETQLQAVKREFVKIREELIRMIEETKILKKDN